MFPLNGFQQSIKTRSDENQRIANISKWLKHLWKMGGREYSTWCEMWNTWLWCVSVCVCATDIRFIKSIVLRFRALNIVIKFRTFFFLFDFRELFQFLALLSFPFVRFRKMNKFCDRLKNKIIFRLFWYFALCAIVKVYDRMGAYLWENKL